MKRMTPWFLLFILALFACEDDGTEPPPDDGNGNGDSTLVGYNLANAFPNLTFARPTDITHAGDGTNRVFVTEQNGIILVFANNSAVASATEFLNISGPVQSPLDSEMGLLGLAFHPDYENNGFFFISYTAGDSSNRLGRVSRFSVSAADSNQADPTSERILLEFQDDYGNHNGGGLCFGTDGYLYIAIGDEGSAGDPNDNAQDRTRIFGKILRVDVDQNVNTIPYHGIPPSNPYAGHATFREDIFAYGLRNPWRISYDANRLFTGDVGQSAQEEIDIIVSGGNYGWDCREGTIAYDEDEDDMSPLCAGASGLREPLFVYGRSQGGSITGGYVYRGPTATSLTGRYIYADYLSGRIWALDVATVTNNLVRDSSLFISTFGEDQSQELFVAGYNSGGNPTALYRIVEIWEEE